MSTATAPDVNFTALASNNTILTYNAKNLATSTSSTAIGLPASENIVVLIIDLLQANYTD
jgi:hypothetical protein